MDFAIHTGNHDNSIGITDTVLFLKAALRDCGHTAVISHEISPQRINIVLEHFIEERHLRPLYDGHVAGARLVLIGTEPIIGGTFNGGIDGKHWHYGNRNYWSVRFESFKAAASLSEAIWVLDESMVAPYQALFPNLPVRFVPHGWVSGFATIDQSRPEAERDIQFFFSGTLTDHRRRVLGALARKHRVVHVPPGTPEYLRQDYLARTQVCLSLRLSEQNVIPSVSRMHYHLQNRNFLLHERYDQACPLDPFVLHADANELLDWADAALQLPNRREIADAALEKFKVALPMTRLLPPLLKDLATAGAASRLALARGSVTMLALDAPIFVAGHRGMVGSALVRALRARGHQHIVLRARAELDLCDGAAVDAFLAAARPAYIFVAAAKVGGIVANQTQPADFLQQNLQIASNLIAGAHRAGVQRLMYFASNCIYPRACAQPMPESALLTGPLEPTNEAYAIAKIAGLKLCEGYQRQHGRDYVTVMPASLYGPNDNYTPGHSHVLPALLRRAHEARERGDAELVVWGSGTPRREFLYVDDLAQACVGLATMNYAGVPINIGSGSDLSIRELAEAVVETVGFKGRLVFDASKPDGMPRKLLDSTRIRSLGWRPTVDLREGLRRAYDAAPWRQEAVTPS